MRRRDLLKAAVAGGAAACGPLKGLAWAGAAEAREGAAVPFFSTNDRRWQTAYDRALAVLAGNVQVLPRFPHPVLIEGAEYAGVWQECGPHEALVYRYFRPDVARNNHMTFFALQREDGQLPADNKRSETGFGQIQMVVPIAATAWELARATGDAELLERAYVGCSRWDAWLMRYRNTRGTGLIEGFCTYDTGMDNSPRWAGMARQCPDKDARRCPPDPGLPRLCPDLSATVYGARVALAAMATALGKRAEADQWSEHAEALRRLIVERLYVAEDAAFYDLDARNEFVKVRSIVAARVCGEHVADAKMFDAMWERQLGNPKAFWAPYPLPSVAMDDPAFVRPIPRNSWGGPSQALTALRAGRWMDFYGRSAEFVWMMQRWCEALVRDSNFRQQMDPVTGEFTASGSASYSPAALVMYDYTWRLAGVREENDELHWNVRPRCAAAEGAVFRLPMRGGKAAEMRYQGAHAELWLGGRRLGQVEGIARLVTDEAGRPLYVLGVDMAPQTVSVRLAGFPHRQLLLKANARETLS
ncbi:MAG TPA: alpha-L-rhamnosidase [Acidobacteriaceae bacterium]|jgi:hypothetical protein|nr:alpha-L-rhamnosidase [Acidobacteriaceae bacterium]